MSLSPARLIRCGVTLCHPGKIETVIARKILQHFDQLEWQSESTLRHE